MRRLGWLLGLSAVVLFLSRAFDRKPEISPKPAAPKNRESLSVSPSSAIEPITAPPERATLRQFLSLREKALRSETEKSALQGLYENREFIQSTKELLKSNDASFFTREREKERFASITFLKSALSGTHDESRERVISAVEEIIETENIAPDLALEIKRSLAGDKIELFQILRRASQTRAEALLGRLGNGKLRALLEKSDS